MPTSTAHDQSPAAFVLGVPELLDNILHYVISSQHHTKNNIYLRVNKTWFSVAVRYVWRRRHEDDIKKIIHYGKMLDHPERLQLYAGCIEHLRIGYNPDNKRRWELVETPEHRLHVGHLVAAVKFPRLWEIHLDNPSYKDDQFSQPLAYLCLQDKLKRLKVLSGAPPAGFWTQLKVRLMASRSMISSWVVSLCDPSYCAFSMAP